MSEIEDWLALMARLRAVIMARAVPVTAGTALLSGDVID
jgi:hypothetical protein